MTVNIFLTAGILAFGISPPALKLIREAGCLDTNVFRSPKAPGRRSLWLWCKSSIGQHHGALPASQLPQCVNHKRNGEINGRVDLGEVDVMREVLPSGGVLSSGNDADGDPSDRE